MQREDPLQAARCQLHSGYLHELARELGQARHLLYQDLQSMNEERSLGLSGEALAAAAGAGVHLLLFGDSLDPSHALFVRHENAWAFARSQAEQHLRKIHDVDPEDWAPGSGGHYAGDPLGLAMDEYDFTADVHVIRLNP